MTISIHQQTYAFAISLLGGISIAIIYDIFRTIRLVMKSSRKIMHLFDIIFWIVAAIMSFYFINIGNDGEIRGFMFIGLIFGGGLYFLIVGNKLVAVMYFIIEKIFILIKFIFKIIITPFKLIIKLITFLLKILGVKK